MNPSEKRLFVINTLGSLDDQGQSDLFTDEAKQLIKAELAKPAVDRNLEDACLAAYTILVLSPLVTQ